VMERVDGPTMLDDLTRRPWRMARHAHTLAELHKQLQSIAAPPSLPAPVGEGGSLLHLDLHPDNVMLSPRGAIVIDWPNAARGPGAADVAHTWIVLACSTPTTGTVRRLASAAGRRAFVGFFLRHFNREQIEAHLHAAGEYRLAHRTLPAKELEAIAAMTRP
jgi:Ser/Thr protein kinase RdoA (MazF antagonist)